MNNSSIKLCYIGALASVHTARWCSYFASKGFEVHVINTSNAINPITDPSIKIHPFKLLRTRVNVLNLLLIFLTLPWEILRLRRMLKQIKPNVIHVHYINEAALYASLSGLKPVVMTPWGSDVLVSAKSSMVRMAALKFILRRADLITCDAEHMKQRVSSLKSPAKNPVEIVFFGTDTTLFRPERFDADLRASLTSDAENVLISTRSLEPIYDIPCLIKAMKYVVKDHPSTMLWVGGSGSELLNLQSIARTEGVEQHVRFLGLIQPTQMPALVASADVYISTSTSDAGIASSTAEAMASGVPSVITDVVDNKLWIEDGVNGFLFPAGDSISLAAKVSRLLSDKPLRKDFGTHGRKTIVQRFDLEKSMRTMASLYHTLARHNVNDEPS